MYVFLWKCETVDVFVCVSLCNNGLSGCNYTYLYLCFACVLSFVCRCVFNYVYMFDGGLVYVNVRLCS